jgi:hypothetical protein
MGRKITEIIYRQYTYPKLAFWSIYLLLFSIFFFLFSVIPASAAVLTKAPNNLGLVGYWSFNEGTSTIAGDFSGNGNHGTLQSFANPPTATSGWGNGKFGHALNFDGADDGVNVGKNPSINDLPSMTISAWVKARSLGEGSVGRIIDKSNSTGYAFWISSTASTNNISFLANFATPMIRRSSSNAIIFNEWRHVVVTWDGSFTAANTHLYVNGVETGYAVTTNGSGGYVSDANDNLVIGNDSPSPVSTFDGLIDEVRVYNRALSASEVTALYSSGAVRFKVPNNLGLVGYWSFNEGTSTIAGDFSGNGNNGSMSGFSNPSTATSGWTDGRLGNALVFDGSDDHVTVPDSPSLSITGDITVSLWFKTAGGVVGDRLIDPRSSTASNTFNMLFLGGDTVAFTIDTGAGVSSQSPTSYSDNNWHHVVGKWDGSDIYLYVDGVQVDSDPQTGSMDNLSAPLIIGDRFDFVGPFNGSIDEVRIYNRSLSEDEVYGLYQASRSFYSTNASQNTRITDGLVGMWSFNGQDIDWATGKAYDRSGQGNNGTVVGMSTSSSPVAGRVGQALSFEGGQGVNSGDITTFDGLSAFTCTFWMYYDSTKNVDETISIIRKDGSATCAQAWVDAPRWRFVLWAPSIVPHAIALSNIPKDRWVHVAHRWQNDINGGTPELFIDGVLIGSFSGSSSGTITNSAAPLFFGRSENNDEHLYGKLDEVRVYNRRLSNEEIKQLYLMGR